MIPSIAIFLSLSALSALSQPQDGSLCNPNQWKLFKEKFNKNYDLNSHEDRHRFAIFCQNWEKIVEHNSRPDVTYEQDLNHFSDFFPEELKKVTLRSGKEGRRMDSESKQDFEDLLMSSNQLKHIIGDINIEPPSELDWSSDPQRVSPPRNQGDCGSCWAFSIVAMLEGQEKPTGRGKLVELSEQNLIDCDEFNDGCEGGTYTDAFKSIRRIGGVMTLEDYPYVSGRTQKAGKCRMDRDKAYKTTKSLGRIKHLKAGNETLLKQIVASYGPVSIVIIAKDNLHNYRSGVYYDAKCNDTPDPDYHGMIVVGYGKDNKTGLDYWKIKNSWSQGWGMMGFGLMSRNRDNNCEIASDAYIILPYD